MQRKYQEMGKGARGHLVAVAMAWPASARAATPNTSVWSAIHQAPPRQAARSPPRRRESWPRPAYLGNGETQKTSQALSQGTYHAEYTRGNIWWCWYTSFILISRYAESLSPSPPIAGLITPFREEACSPTYAQDPCWKNAKARARGKNSAFNAL